MTSTGSSTSSIDKPSLVYQLQKMNGMEKKRRSRTRRDQLAANKPGSPYQKSRHHTRTDTSTAQQTPPGPSGHLPSRCKDVSRFSGVEASASCFDPLPPRASSDEHILPQSSATSLSRSSSPSSPYHLSAGTSSSPGSTNLSPLQVSLPTPIPTSNQFQHMVLTSQTTPGSLSTSSPGCHEFQGYNHPAELRVQHPVSHAIPVDGLHLVTQYDGVCGPSRPHWNEYNGRQGRIELSMYPRLTHRPEQVTAAPFLPPMLHGLGTPPPIGNSSCGYFYPDYEDRTASTSLQDAYLLAGHSSEAGSSGAVPYYS